MTVCSLCTSCCHGSCSLLSKTKLPRGSSAPSVQLAPMSLGFLPPQDYRESRSEMSQHMKLEPPRSSAPHGGSSSQACGRGHCWVALRHGCRTGAGYGASGLGKLATTLSAWLCRTRLLSSLIFSPCHPHIREIRQGLVTERWHAAACRAQPLACLHRL